MMWNSVGLLDSCRVDPVWMTTAGNRPQCRQQWTATVNSCWQ